MQNKFKQVDWLKSSNVYEVNVRQYTPEGTFAAFQPSLDRLKDMSVEILWFMPITPISQKKRLGSLGSYYACSDYTAINPEFGTINDFKELVASAHSKGMKVIIDIVANHTGWDHVWTKKHPEYYKKSQQGEFYDSHGWEDVIDLNYDNPQLRKAMIGVLKFWVDECNVDGFRCDMAHLVPLDFWKEARTEIEKEHQLFWLAETEVASYHEVFDATYAWKFLHAAEKMYQGKSTLKQLESVLCEYDVDFPKDAYRLYFTSNHDENSHSGSEYERFGKSAAAFAVFTAFWRNSLPLIYSGQELPNKKRLLFFDKDEIDWNGHIQLHSFYKTLLKLRHNHENGNDAREMAMCEKVNTSDDDKIFGFVRKQGTRYLLVLLNLSPVSKLNFTLHSEIKAGIYCSVFSRINMPIDRHSAFELQAWEYLVYELVQ